MQLTRLMTRLTCAWKRRTQCFFRWTKFTRIYYYKFEKQDKRKAKERIRDLFVVGCLTALRYSDYSALTKDNLQNGYIVKRTKKTNVDVKVPAHDYVKEIFAKYGGNIPSWLCIQYFNKYLKVIMKEIGLNDLITFSYTQGGKLKTVTREKWELISSHTARRSAATNMYLTGRMKTFEIMKLTGHRSEQNFFRYIRLTGNDTARSISGDIFFRKWHFYKWKYLKQPRATKKRPRYTYKLVRKL